MKIARLRKKRKRKLNNPLNNKELRLTLLRIRYARVNHMVKEIKRLCLDYRVLFYHIDHIHEELASTEEKPLSVIFSGGEQYIVKHSLIDLAQKIAKAQ